MTKTNLDVIEAMDLPRWNGDYGQRFIGVLLGMVNDMVAEAASIALMAPCCSLPREQPSDAVDLVAADALLPHYPGESYDALRARVLGKWDLWTGGPLDGLLAELAAAFPDTPFTVTTPQDTSLPMPSGYWSAFWLNCDGGDLPVKVIGPGTSIVGAAIVGRDSVGPYHADNAAGLRMFRLIKSITARMKPVNWVCWNLRIAIPAGEFVNLMVHKRTTAYDSGYIYHET